MDREEEKKHVRDLEETVDNMWRNRRHLEKMEDLSAQVKELNRANKILLRDIKDNLDEV